MSTEQDPTVAHLKRKWPPTEQTIITLYASEATWPGDSAEVTAWRSKVASYIDTYRKTYDEKYTQMVEQQYPDGQPANANTKGWSTFRGELGWKALDTLQKKLLEVYNEQDGPVHIQLLNPSVFKKDPPAEDVTATAAFFWGRQYGAVEHAVSDSAFEKAPDLYLSTAPGGTATPPSTTGDVSHGSAEKCTIL